MTTTSPALQVPSVVAITNELGEYRCHRCPSARRGDIHAAGILVRETVEIRLTVGFVAKLDVVLKVGSLEESVTVSGGRRSST